MSRIISAARVAAVAFAIAACSGDGASPASPSNGGGDPKPVASVSITPATATVIVGTTRQLAATLEDAAGNRLTGRAVTWTSSATSVATVDANGLVTAVTAGTANISAASEGKSAQAAITVSLVPVASVTVAPNAPSIAIGGTATLTATAKDEQGNVLT